MTYRQGHEADQNLAYQIKITGSLAIRRGNWSGGEGANIQGANGAAMVSRYFCTAMSQPLGVITGKSTMALARRVLTRMRTVGNVRAVRRRQRFQRAWRGEIRPDPPELLVST